MASSSLSQDKLTDKKSLEDELENGGLSSQPSLRTNIIEDDACSEIVRIEQRETQEEHDDDGTALGRIVKTFQVSCCIFVNLFDVCLKQSVCPWTLFYSL